MKQSGWGATPWLLSATREDEQISLLVFWWRYPIKCALYSPLGPSKCLETKRCTEKATRDVGGRGRENTHYELVVDWLMLRGLSGRQAGKEGMGWMYRNR
jgi:hypothetical protein